MIQKKQISEVEALRKLGDLCARGEHCSGEMTEKLRKCCLLYTSPSPRD